MYWSEKRFCGTVPLMFKMINDNHSDVNVGSLTTKTLCGFRLLNSWCKKCSLQDVNAPHCAYAGSGFWLNANSKRQAQHHVLPNCGRKPAPSSCEPTPRLPPELLPEDLWWAPSPGCPPWKEVRPVLGGQPHFGTKESDSDVMCSGSSAWLTLSGAFS